MDFEKEAKVMVLIFISMILLSLITAWVYQLAYRAAH